MSEHDRCAEHRDRQATHVAFGTGWAAGTMGAQMLGRGGFAWNVCASCADNFHVACPRPFTVREARALARMVAVHP